MYPVFIELTYYSNSEKITVNAATIASIEEAGDRARRIYLIDRGFIIVKETREQILTLVSKVVNQ